MYGVGVAGIAPSHLKHVRSQTASAFRVGGPMSSVDLGMVVHGRRDPAVKAVGGPRQYADPSTPSSHVLHAVYLVEAFHAIRHGAVSDGTNEVRGRKCALLCSLNRIGWTFVSSTSLCRHDGGTISLLLVSPASRESRARAAVPTQSPKGWASKDSSKRERERPP